MESSRDKAIHALRTIMPDRLPEGDDPPTRSGDFADEFLELSLNNVFGALWAREGLDARSRSLVTLGILIALRAEDQLRVHVGAALRHGLTVAELEEVIYHATGYAGFPAASMARSVAADVVRELG